MIGKTVSHYRILEKLGEGGMGVVYAAEDLRLGRTVAIKFLASSTDNQHFRARFLREARSVSLLSHTNIATLFDYGETEEDQPFIVMELVKGRPLNELLAAGELTIARSVEIVARVADALAEAHSRGIIHRDVKPSNIVVNERGIVKVLDFGLAKQIGTDFAGPSDPEARTLLATRTQSDVVVGTPLYLSPEQATSGIVDGRSDLFALGALLYEAIAGRPTFSGSSVMEIGAQVIHIDPPPPSSFNPAISKELDRITLKALEKKPEARYQTAEQMRLDLESVLPSFTDNNGHRVSRIALGSKLMPSAALLTFSDTLRRPRLSIFSLLLVLACMGVIGWLGWRVLAPAVHKPTPEALRWYDKGTGALRDGAYYQASLMLQKAVEADPGYSLAHARLAEAYMEIDFADKAKDELLNIQPALANPSTLSKEDALYLAAINAIARRDIVSAIRAYGEIAQRMPKDSRVYVDLGRAYERNDQVDKAIENYRKAIELDGDYATAYLRAGVLYGRRRDVPTALSSLQRAETLFKSLLANPEGLAEVFYQRGIALRRLRRLDEAKAQFQQALDTAGASFNQSQQVAALLGLSTVEYMQGNFSKSKEDVLEARELAQKEGLENLASRGLNDLGVAVMQAGNFVEAEGYFKESLELAKRNKAPVTEAISLENLGSCYIQQRRADEGLPLVEQGLTFFKQGSYHYNIFNSLVLIGRGNRIRGDYNSALQAFEETRQLAEASGDESELAFSFGEIASLYAEIEDYPKALSAYQQSYAYYKSLADKVRLSYNLQNQGDMEWRLGRYADALTRLTQAAETANNGEVSTHLQLVIYLSRSQLALSQGNLAEAEVVSQKMIKLAGDQYTDYVSAAKSTLGLAKAMSGRTKEGIALCDEAVSIAKSLSDEGLMSRALLARAMALYLSGNIDEALTSTSELTARLSKGPHLESARTTALIAALASIRKNDGAGPERLKYADELSSRLSKQWGDEYYKSYLERKDVRFLNEQIDRYRPAP
jgi:tetratricopeptide (TPR) repeat protein/predicted Ser/Thr protein kinase